MFFVVLLLHALVSQSFCHSTFRSKIPNGFNVPNPCRIPAVWNPVGHYNPEHYTHIKNPFAIDFRKNDFVWNATICNKDSDGDGMTNGDELGDSNCTWRPGKTAFNPVGHPGICEPVGSTQCRRQNFSCDCLENCQGLLGHA